MSSQTNPPTENLPEWYTIIKNFLREYECFDLEMFEVGGGYTAYNLLRQAAEREVKANKELDIRRQNFEEAISRLVKAESQRNRYEELADDLAKALQWYLQDEQTSVDNGILEYVADRPAVHALKKYREMKEGTL